MRLASALGASLVLHGVSLFGTRVGPGVGAGGPSRILEARLATVASGHAQEKAPAASEPRPSGESLPPVAPGATESPVETPATLPEDAAPERVVDVPLPPDENYYPAREVDEHPVLVSGGRPVYPERAGLENVGGEVLVLMLLNEQGLADVVEIVEAKPEGYGFEEAVVDWLKHARFEPAVRKGRVVKARVVYRVTFEP